MDEDVAGSVIYDRYYEVKTFIIVNSLLENYKTKFLGILLTNIAHIISVWFQKNFIC